MVARDAIHEQCDPEVTKSCITRFFCWFHSRLLYGYFTPYMKKAQREGAVSVRPEKLPNLWQSDDTAKWSRRFIHAAREQWERPNGPSRHALVITLIKVFWLPFLAILAVSVLDVKLTVSSISFMKKFLAWQEKGALGRTQNEIIKGVCYGLATLLIELLKVFVKSQLSFGKERVALRVEGALSTALFRRVLMPARSSEQTQSYNTSTSKSKKGTDPKTSAYNVLMLDVPSVARAIYLLADACTLPFLLLESFRVLNTQVGPPAIVGLCVLVFTMGTIFSMEIYNGFLKKPLLHNRDIRIDRTHEILSEIKGLRMIGWDDIAYDCIDKSRQKEMKVRKLRMYIHQISWGISDHMSKPDRGVGTSFCIRGLCVVGYANSRVAIPVMQVVAKLVEPLSNTSFLTHTLVEAAVSMKRYQGHLFGSANQFQPKLRKSKSSISTLGGAEEENEERGRLLSDASVAGSSTFSARGSSGAPEASHRYLLVQNATYVWSQARSENDVTMETPKPLENDLKDKPAFTVAIDNLEIYGGECVFLVGAAGSGKSSVLLALLGEMSKIHGYSFVTKAKRTEAGVEHIHPYQNIKRSTCVGYASQPAWIPEGSVRSAILFGRPFDPVRYQRAIDACDLVTDFTSWEDGDQRLVLQGGQNLSGGQRARIALARAVYDFPIHHYECDTEQQHASRHREAVRGTKCFFLDDPCSSADPRVGSLIFTRLFGPNGLLKHGATVMAVDQPSLVFYLKMLRIRGIEPSVKFQMKVIENGVLRDLPMDVIYHQLPPLAQSTISTSEAPTPTSEFMEDLKNQGEKLNSPTVEELASGSATSEQSFSGVVGKATYRWFGKHIGLFLSLSMLVLVLALCTSNMVSQFWIAHWTAVSHNEEKVTKGPILNEVSMNNKSSFFQFGELDEGKWGNSFLETISQVETSQLREKLENITQPLSTLQTERSLENSDNRVSSVDRNDTIEPVVENSDSIGQNSYERVAKIHEAPTAEQSDRATYEEILKDKSTASIQPTENSKGSVVTVGTHSHSEPQHIEKVSEDSSEIISRETPNSVENMNELTPFEIPQEVTQKDKSTTEDSSGKPDEGSHMNTIVALIIFLEISFFNLSAQVLLACVNVFASVRAAINIHSKLLHSVINAPFWLYDYISVGVMINRFSSDMQAIDTSPINGIVMTVQAWFKTILIVFALCILGPWCAPLIPIVGWVVYRYVYTLYRPTCREFQRSKLLAYSPLCNNFSEAETGAVVIRALGGEEYYSRKNVQLTSNLIKAEFMQSGANNWATLRLQLLSYPLTFANFVFPSITTAMNWSTLSFFTRSMGGINAASAAGFVGLAMDFAARLPKYIGDCALTVANIERSMCSVQRVREVVDMAEHPQATGKKNKWGHVAKPDYAVESCLYFPVVRSGLRLENVSVAYQRVQPEDDASDRRTGKDRFSREYLEPALKDVTAFAKTGQHIGVVGRTGAGKSTLLLALLNLVPATEGTITIDGVPLSNISPKSLRELVGVLPQVPIILKGWTIRRFLDPFHEFSTDQLMVAIDRVGMSNIIINLPEKLETIILQDEYEEHENGQAVCNSVVTEQVTVSGAKALSDSQLRILAIARLALHADRYRLVLVDEPPARQVYHSAAADNYSEVADILCSTFPRCTVVIVAHHASTVKNCDKLWIFSKGRFIHEVPGTTITSQETLMKVITDAEDLAESRSM